MDLEAKVNKLKIEDGDVLVIRAPEDYFINSDWYLAAISIKEKLAEVGKHIAIIVVAEDVQIENIPSKALLEQGFIRTKDAYSWIYSNVPLKVQSKLTKSFQDRFWNA
jgi:hypothetical protein